MRYILFIFLFSFSFYTNSYAQNIDSTKTSVSLFEMEHYDVFGDEKILGITADASTLSKVISEIDSKTEVFVQTKINKVCQMDGCFFTAIDGEFTARVTFKDYGFVIPTNSTGKEVFLEGILSKKIISEKQAKHFAEDLGEEPEKIVGEQVEDSIIATSVLIPKSK